MKHLYSMVGHLIVSFGLFEFGLDSLTAIAYHRGGSAFRQRLPVPLSERTAFIVECVEKLAWLAPHANDLRRIMAAGERLALIRNDIVHGYIAEYDEGSNHTLLFIKASVDKRTRRIHRRVLRKITAQELVEAGNEVTDISGTLATLNLRLVEIPDPTIQSAPTA